MAKNLIIGTQEYNDTYFPVCVYKMAKIGKEYSVKQAKRYSTRRKATDDLRAQFSRALDNGIKAIKDGTSYFFTMGGVDILLYVGTYDKIDASKMRLQYDKMEAMQHNS